MSIGILIKVLHEAEGHTAPSETNASEVYHGKLIEAVDNMNCQMSNTTVTYRDGRVAQLGQVYIRGSKLPFLILPDTLKNAPMLKSMKNKNQGPVASQGKAAVVRKRHGNTLQPLSFLGRLGSAAGVLMYTSSVSFRHLSR